MAGRISRSAAEASAARRQAWLRSPGTIAAAIALGWLLLALHGIGDAPIVGDDEAREAGIVRDVVAGHVLLPRFSDTLLPDKPVLSHWLAAVPVAVAGFSETSVRVTTALAGAGVVGWTAWFGATLLGPPAGIAAGLLVGTMPALFSHSRVCRPDALLVLLLACAFGAAWRWWRERDRRAATWVWVWLGLGVFAKGPVAPALFAMTLGLFLLWQRDLRRLWQLLTPLGVAAFLLLGGSWYAVALAGWGRFFVRQHLVGRYVRNLAGGLARGGAYSPKPWWYHVTFYPLHLLAIGMPWTPLVGVALWRLWRMDALRDPRARFLICWVVAPVLVFTPAEWKLRYYLLPSLPPLALLAAPTAALVFTEVPAALRPARWSVAVAGAAIVATAVAGWLVLARPDLLSHADQTVVAAAVPAFGGPANLAAALGVLVGVGAVAVACRVWAVVVGLAGLGALGWLALGAPAVEAQNARRDGLRDFAGAVVRTVPADASLAFWGEPVRSIIVYAGRPIGSLRHEPEHLVAGGWLLATEPAWHALHDAGLVGDGVVRGTGRVGNLERGEMVLAPITRSPEPPPPTPPAEFQRRHS